MTIIYREIEWTFNKEKFGRDVRNERIASLSTQEALGAALGVTGSCVSSWERGVEPPGTKHFIEVCNLLGLDPREYIDLDA